MTARIIIEKNMMSSRIDDRQWVVFVGRNTDKGSNTSEVSPRFKKRGNALRAALGLALAYRDDNVGLVILYEPKPGDTREISLRALAHAVRANVEPRQVSR